MSQDAQPGKACGCPGACTPRCRLDRYAQKRAETVVERAREAAPLPVNGSGLKPSALRILGALQRSPQTNKALMNLAGFRYSSRVHELRLAGHHIRCEAPGPTPGVRLYTLEGE